MSASAWGNLEGILEYEASRGVDLTKGSVKLVDVDKEYAPKPSYLLTSKEVETADFEHYGFILRVEDRKAVSNIEGLCSHFDPDAWHFSDTLHLLSLSELVLNTYLLNSLQYKTISLSGRTSLIISFYKEVISSMPSHGGRIPYETISAWIEEQRFKHF